jgi:hypothetical protein
MSISTDKVVITARPQDVNINIEQGTGDINIKTVPEVITVQVGATVQTSSGTFVIGEQPIGIVNGSNATFYSEFSFEPDSIQVFVNGVNQALGIDFYTISSNTIILNTSPITGDILRINYKVGE